MPQKQINWEIMLLAFAVIFTVIAGVGSIISAFFGGGVPWIQSLVLTLLILGVARYMQQRPKH